jgi:hypothetical protein
MGPVGLADQLNATVGPIAATSCSRDGTLLHPSRPATPIDATFLGQLDGGSVLVAHYGPRDDSADVATGLVRAYVIAVTGASTSIAADDLWPSPAPDTRLMLWKWNGTDAAGPCVAGADAGGCLSALPVRGSVPVSAGSKETAVYHMSPVLPGGWVVLGETAKVSTAMFCRAAVT